MFVRRRGEWIADVTLPTTEPPDVAGHFTVLSPGKGAPSSSTPLICLAMPAAAIRLSAAIETHASSGRSSTSRPRPSSYGLFSYVMSAPQLKIAPSIRRMSDGPVGRTLYGAPAFMTGPQSPVPSDESGRQI